MNVFIFIKTFLVHLFETIVLHTRRNDSDGLNSLLRLVGGDEINGIFIDPVLTPMDVTWIKYPKNIRWHHVKSYNEFRATLNWTRCDVVSVGVEQNEMMARCLNLLQKMKQVNLQDPAAVYFHAPDTTLRTELQPLWPNARIQ